MAYSEPKLTSNGDKASYFIPYLKGNVSEKSLPSWTPLQVSFSTFYKPYFFHRDTKHTEIITEDLPRQKRKEDSLVTFGV
jgi:hypothetical protein